MSPNDLRPTPPADGAVDGASGAEKLRLVLAWLFVGIPAAWGIIQVFKRALALFQ
ncbi:MAG TPA: hypothetical protein VEI06_13605 [Gemmatimonadaceae bacterium]|nr:hypothetical protein [Gemmatimonadaceae bacterium]